jgi:hypothetical protein
MQASIYALNLGSNLTRDGMDKPASIIVKSLLLTLGIAVAAVIPAAAISKSALKRYWRAAN